MFQFFIKKGKKDLRDNYRPVGILPIMSKLFEKKLHVEANVQIFRKYIFENTMWL